MLNDYRIWKRKKIGGYNVINNIYKVIIFKNKMNNVIGILYFHHNWTDVMNSMSLIDYYSSKKYKKITTDKVSIRGYNDESTTTYSSIIYVPSIVFSMKYHRIHSYYTLSAVYTVQRENIHKCE
jgi:hypothetical protein